jgi:hypothetical protein
MGFAGNGEIYVLILQKVAIILLGIKIIPWKILFFSPPKKNSKKELKIVKILHLLYINVLHIFVLFFLLMKGSDFVCMFRMCILE